MMNNNKKKNKEFNRQHSEIVNINIILHHIYFRFHNYKYQRYEENHCSYQPKRRSW